MHLGHHANGGRSLAHLRLRRPRDTPKRENRNRVTDRDFAEWIANSPESPLAATPEGADRDAWFDVKVIYQQDHTSVDINAVPQCSNPKSDRSGSRTTRRSTPRIPPADIFDLRGLDRGGVVVVVVRPDQYVANVLPLTATAELAAFFAPLLQPRQSEELPSAALPATHTPIAVHVSNRVREDE